MYPVKVFLARRSPQTIKSYTRSLKLFAAHLGTDIDHLHEYLQGVQKETLIGDLITFADSLSKYNQNGQRHVMAGVMSYLSYNEITVPKAHKTQIVPKKGDLLRDKAFTRPEVLKVFNTMKNPIGRISLLLLFCSGMRSGELLCLKESDLFGRMIHIRSECAKNKKEREVVITPECADYLYNIWLPMKDNYLKSAENKNQGLKDMENVRKAGQKSVHDDRVIPIHETTLSEILSRAFKTAGFTVQSADGRNLYHPHSLRKSFRTIVGSVDVDLAEGLMGHSGYLNESYVRKDIQKEYDEKVSALLTISGADPMLKSRVDMLETALKEKDEQFQEFVRNFTMKKFVLQDGTELKFNKESETLPGKINSKKISKSSKR